MSAQAEYNSPVTTKHLSRLGPTSVTFSNISFICKTSHTRARPSPSRVAKSNTTQSRATSHQARATNSDRRATIEVLAAHDRPPFSPPPPYRRTATEGRRCRPHADQEHRKRPRRNHGTPIPQRCAVRGDRQ